MKAITNCPNCGAPIKRYGTCEYCGTVIQQPIQMIAVRPGVRKLVCQMQMPLEIGEQALEKDHVAVMAAEYAMRGVRDKMADALADSIKFIARRDFDPHRFQEIITVRGELWVADPDLGY